MMERQRPQSKVTLEDLIRLKRAERPPQEFWAEFESQLRHKQLAAIVDKRPWWRRCSFANIAKLSLPVGATAIVALTLTTFRERFQPAPATAAPLTALAASSNHGSGSVAEGAGSAADQASYVSRHSPTQQETAAGLSRGSEQAAARAHEQLVASVLTDDALVSRAEKETSLAQVILGIEESALDAQPRFEEPVTIASASMIDAVSASSPGAAQVPVSLSDLASSIDARRARLLVSVDADESATRKDNSRVARTRDRIASRLNEQALSDSIRRLGVNGDSVSIKF